MFSCKGLNNESAHLSCVLSVGLLTMADAKYQDRVTQDGKYNPVISYPELAKARELSSQSRTAFRRFGKLGLDLSQNRPHLSLVNLLEVPPDRFLELDFIDQGLSSCLLAR